jgi:hypothetical protein
MTAMQSYLNDASAAQSGQANSSESSKWNFHGDAHGSLDILGFGRMPAPMHPEATIAAAAWII